MSTWDLRTGTYLKLVSADGVKIMIEMRSCWIKVGLTSNDSFPLNVGVGEVQKEINGRRSCKDG